MNRQTSPQVTKALLVTQPCVKVPCSVLLRMPDASARTAGLGRPRLRLYNILRHVRRRGRASERAIRARGLLAARRAFSGDPDGRQTANQAVVPRKNRCRPANRAVCAERARSARALVPEVE